MDLNIVDPPPSPITPCVHPAALMVFCIPGRLTPPLLTLYINRVSLNPSAGREVYRGFFGVPSASLCHVRRDAARFFPLITSTVFVK